MIRDSDADIRSRKAPGAPVQLQYNSGDQQQQGQQYPPQYYAQGNPNQQQASSFPAPNMPAAYQQGQNQGGYQQQAPNQGYQPPQGNVQYQQQGGDVAFSLPDAIQQQQSHGHSSSNGYGSKFQHAQADAGHLARCRADNKKSMQTYSNFMYFSMALCALGSLVALLSMGTSGGYIVWVLMVCAGSFVYMLQLTSWIFKKDDAVPEMRRISEFIRDGSEGYLRVQYNAIAWISIVVAFIVGSIYMLKQSPSKDVSRFTVAFLTGVSFLFGAACSAVAGYIGVWVSVRVNIRVAIAASRYSYSDALLLSFRGGAVSATLSAALCILGITILYLICHIIFVNFKGLDERLVPMLLAGYGFGASMVALFMQLGGGIYTKAADVGADMVGKIEAGIPEDDPRNPAVIADLVGDNVGDCAGSMADVFESIAAEIIGTMILGSTLAHDAGIEASNFLFFPLVVHSFDLIISGIGIYSVYSKSDTEDPLKSMQRSYGLCIVMALVCFTGICRFMLYTDVAPQAWMYFAACGVVGNMASWGLVATTTYYTDYRYAPVKGIASASQTGHGTNVIAGMAVGLESTRNPTIIICLSIFTSYYLGLNSGLPGHQAGVFGTAVATMGMLCTAVFVLSMNNFGPIADNAGGIVEMSEQPESVRVITDRLDAVGNVTKAASKGYAVGGSALACFVLFQAFMDEISQVMGKQFHVINLAKVEVVLGGMIGIMLIFLFAGMAMTAVGSTAQKVVWEVRRQFKEKPGIMNNTELPDYNKCVQIVTKAALREMTMPSLIALTVPVVVGFFGRYVGNQTGQYELGVEVVCGFMVFGTLSGLMLAIVMDNAGGAWDNAKKLIESQGSKGTLAHAAAVTGDTVGDPFKDTAGPSLHVITVTMSTTILVLGPLFLGGSASQW